MQLIAYVKPRGHTQSAVKAKLKVGENSFHIIWTI